MSSTLLIHCHIDLTPTETDELERAHKQSAEQYDAAVESIAKLKLHAAPSVKFIDGEEI